MTLSSQGSASKDVQWVAYFDNPGGFYDNRASKTNPRGPDFVAKDRCQPLVYFPAKTLFGESVALGLEHLRRYDCCLRQPHCSAGGLKLCPQRAWLATCRVIQIVEVVLLSLWIVRSRVEISYWQDSLSLCYMISFQLK